MKNEDINIILAEFLVTESLNDTVESIRETVSTPTVMGLDEVREEFKQKVNARLFAIRIFLNKIIWDKADENTKLQRELNAANAEIQQLTHRLRTIEGVAQS